MKLVKFWLIKGAGYRAWIINAAGLIMLAGILLPANGSRTHVALPFTSTWRCEKGLKISYFRLVWPRASVPTAPPRRLEKSPVRNAAVGTVMLVMGCGFFCRVNCVSTKKNNLFFLMGP